LPDEALEAVADQLGTFYIIKKARAVRPEPLAQENLANYLEQATAQSSEPTQNASTHQGQGSGLRDARTSEVERMLVAIARPLVVAGTAECALQAG